MHEPLDLDHRPAEEPLRAKKTCSCTCSCACNCAQSDSAAASGSMFTSASAGDYDATLNTNPAGG